MKKTLAILLTFAMIIGTCAFSMTASAKGAQTNGISAKTTDLVTKHPHKQLPLKAQTDYLTVTGAFSSPHDYENDYYELWKYVNPDTAAKYLKVTFSANTATEEGCDYIYIYDSEGYFVAAYSGDELAGKTINVIGNAFYLEFSTDRHVTGYGFDVTAVVGETSSIVSGTCGTALGWDFDLDSGVLNITGTGTMTNFIYDQDTYDCNTPWRWFNSYILEIVVGSGATSIGDYAFSDCYGLTAVTIGSSVVSIGDYAFAWCWYLESVEIPNAVQTICEGAFYDCEALTTATLGTGLKTIGDSAFFACLTLTSAEIPAGVTAIGDGAFGICSGLTEITVDDANANYTSLSGVLYSKDMTILLQYPAGMQQDIDIFDDYDWSGIGYTVPETVTDIGAYAFALCSLNYIDLSRNLAFIGDYAFGGNYLSSLNIGSKVTHIGEGAFIENYDLSEVYFSGNAPAMGKYVFDDCGYGYFTIYYLEGKTGFSKSWYGYSTQALAPYVSITSWDTNLEDGEVIPLKLEPFGFYRDVTYWLGYTSDLDIANVEWKSDNKKVVIDEEGNISNRGLFARSANITLTVTDNDGVSHQQTVKIVFYKYNWQLKGLMK